MPGSNKDTYNVKKYFVLAKQYTKNKEYEKACDIYEKILLLEPYNHKATYDLKQLYKKINNIGKKRKYLQMKEKLSQSEWGYTLPIRTRIKEDNILPAPEVEKTGLHKIKEKLRNIIIPKVELDDASLTAVVGYLRKEAKIYDKQDNKGINIDLRLSNKKIGDKTITMYLENIPLGNLLKYLCVYLNLDYKIEEHAVIIGDTSFDKMIVEYILIKSDIINAIAEINTFEISEELDIQDAQQLTAEDKTEIKPVEITNDSIKTFFIERGVTFPNGSSIAWDINSSTLVVNNTQENIKTLKELLQEIDISVPLVLIETKFVEMDQKKYEGFGFDWKFSLDGINGTNWDINKFVNTDGTIQDGNDALNRVGQLSNIAYGTPLYLPNLEGTLDFNLYALDQTGITETLSAPKIITKSGSTAIIEVLQKNWYATSWSVTDPELVYETVTITPPTPTFEEFRLGVVMQVKPTVSPNNKTIFLDLYPMIREFDEYDDEFDYEVLNLSDSKVDPATNKPDPFYTSPLLMPKIISRDFKSIIKVNDGETVVLGGMLLDRTESYDDKYPIIGDIPLLGRLFRTQYEDVTKTNLLIFVTVKLVQPDGTLLNRPKATGKFDFKNT